MGMLGLANALLIAVNLTVAILNLHYRAGIKRLNRERDRNPSAPLLSEPRIRQNSQIIV